MLPHHSNLKEFDKRTLVEAKKVQDLAKGMEKFKKALDE